MMPPDPISKALRFRPKGQARKNKKHRNKCREIVLGIAFDEYGFASRANFTLLKEHGYS
jgi:hypothetical protein